MLKTAAARIAIRMIATTTAAVTGAGAAWYATRALRTSGTAGDVACAGLLYATAIGAGIVARGRR